MGPHPAVAVDAEDLEPLAAVRVSAPAGVAVRVVDVRLDRAAVAHPDVRDPRPDLDDLDPQLVAGNPRVTEERHLAEVAADVRTADPDPVDAHERLTRAGSARCVGLNPAKVLRRLKKERFHSLISQASASAGRGSLLSGRPST